MQTGSLTRKRNGKKNVVVRRKRLSPDDRRKLILDGAISFFAEEGFEGGTRALAKRLGVTQPLIYNYFPTKEDLVREVYENVFVGRWRSEWTDLLSDRGRPLYDRLVDFYLRYTEIIFSPDWIRIYLQAGLKGFDINTKWISFVEGHLARLICNEIRYGNGLPTLQGTDITPQEIDAFWLFHGGLFYYGVRRELYHASVHLSRREFVESSVASMLASLSEVMKKALTDATV